MRFSVFSVLDEEEDVRRTRGGDRYEEALALARRADRDGLHTFWVAEHHFHTGGVLPSPPVLLAAAARETRRIRLGVMVAVLPLHRPVELAEQYALVDHLTGGRLEIGVGSGYVPNELDAFGVPAAQRRTRFDEAYPTFLRALQGAEVPAPGDPQRSVRCNVRTVQAPHPPLWMAVQRREALPFVALRGLSVALIPYASLGSLEELPAFVQEYRRALPTPSTEAEAGSPTPRVAAAFHVYVGGRPKAGREALQRYLDARLSTQSVHYQARVAAVPEAATAEGLIDRGLALVGPPDRVLERVRAIEQAGVTDLLGIFDFGGLDPHLAERSLHRFARSVGLGTPRPQVEATPEPPTGR